MSNYVDINLKGNVVTDIEAYKNYVKNILLTSVGEVPSNRAFGSFLEKYLFEPYDFRIKKLINMEVKRALTKWLKNVNIISVDNVVDVNNQKLVIYVVLEVKGINHNNIVETEIQFNLDKGRQ